MPSLNVKMIKCRHLFLCLKLQISLSLFNASTRCHMQKYLIASVYKRCTVLGEEHETDEDAEPSATMSADSSRIVRTRPR